MTQFRSRYVRRWRVIALGTAALLMLGSGGSSGDTPTPSQADGAAPDGVTSRVGALWHVSDPGPGVIMNYPHAFATDTVVDGVSQRRVVGAWNGETEGATYSTKGYSFESDNGARFNTVRPVDGNPDTWGRLEDGSMLSIDFLAPVYSGSHLKITTRRSTDLGASWEEPAAAPLETGDLNFYWIRVHRGMVTLPDGTLLVPIYGPLRNDAPPVVMRTFVIQSTDQGRSWSVRSAMGPATKVVAEGTNEGWINWTSDGRLIGLLRSNDETRLMVTFSDDEGRSWSPMQPIDPPGGAPVGMADPAAVLMPNGQLVIAYGRPDNTILVSRDGTGRTWDEYHNVFANKPRDNYPGDIDGTSGNMALVSAAANQAVVFGDTCGHTWMCREHGQDFGIWARQLDLLTPGVGKIDLATGIHDGTFSIKGGSATRPAFPETRPEGSVDGSSAPHAAAEVAADGALIITLDKARRIDRLGLMLGHGQAQSADVQLSTRPNAWGKPVVKARDTRDFALRYTEIEPKLAKYIRITPADGKPITVTEFEAYDADTDTFENDAPMSVPRGWVDTRYAWVNDTAMPGFHSKRRLSLIDQDGAAAAAATLRTTARPDQRAEFAYSAVQYAAGVQWKVNGLDASGDPVQPWQFRITPSGKGFGVASFDGNEWRTIGVTTTRPPNKVWTTARIDATPTSATVTIGGESFTTTTPAGTARQFTGLTFDTDFGKPARSGMEHDFDDVRVTSVNAGS